MALPSSRSPSLLPCVGFALAAGLAAQKGLPVVSPTGAQNPAVAAAFAQFQRDHGDGWQVRWHPATGTPMALYGPGLPLADWRENALPEARRHALRMLQEQAGLLGLGTSEFRERQGCRIGRQWAFVFDQFFGGLPVLDGRADVRVSMAGRVSMFGSTAVPVPADFVTMPAIGAELAAATAWQSLGVPLPGAALLAPMPAPRLVVWSDLGAAAPVAVRLAWEVACRGVDASGREHDGRVYVDAQTAAVLQFRNDLHECGVAGCHHRSPAPTRAAVAPVAVVGASTSTPLAAPVPTGITVFAWIDGASVMGAMPFFLPMPGLSLQVPGVGTVTTDTAGHATVDLLAPVQVAYQGLIGRHHRRIQGGDAPSGSFTLVPGQSAVLTLLSPISSDRELAHTSVSFWTDRCNEFCRSVLGNTPELALTDQIGALVNLPSTCNALYRSSSNSMEFQEATGSCLNTAHASLIAHEWGHGLDHQYGFISTAQGLSEGWADIVAMYLLDYPVIADGIYGPGTRLRTGLNTRQFPSGSGLHEKGETWMGFAWKLREQLAITNNHRATAIAVTNDIVLGSIPANAPDQQAAILEVFLADDNDGILSNGTPHYAELSYACGQHSLPFPVQGPPANDECAQAITVQNGSNGPFTNVFATTSAPVWSCTPATGADVWFRYTNGGLGTMTVSTCAHATFDTVIEVFTGNCGALQSVGCADDSCGYATSVSVQVPPGPVYIRVGGYGGATGNFSLDITNTAVSAGATSLGTGCYRLSPAFYEFFPPGAFDLNGRAMRLEPDGFGQQRVIEYGAFAWPQWGSAVTLPLGDDTDAPVNLPTPFPYPGGTTNQLVVCSNGYVSVSYGNGAGNDPAPAHWLLAQHWLWGTWQDFDPSAGGSVLVNSVNHITYITWLDVPTKGYTDANTWQLQFDRNTGAVTWAWLSMSGIGKSLIGSNRGLHSLDLGNYDLSAQLPSGFRVGSTNLNPMELAATVPTFGGTATFTTTSIPANAAVLMQVIGLTPYPQGLDMGPLGMPGCRQYASADAVFTLVPSGGQAVYTIGVPNDIGLMGLPLVGQTLAFAPGLNTLGVLASNGVHAVVGY